MNRENQKSRMRTEHLRSHTLPRLRQRAWHEDIKKPNSDDRGPSNDPVERTWAGRKSR